MNELIYVKRLSRAAGRRAEGPTEGSKMAQTQGTRGKVCYYYDGFL